MFKKKRGSTLVTVLAVAVVFMTLAAAIITSIMGTMKSNTNQKVREDLRYAAESGLEIAKSYLEGKGTITQDDINEINERLEDVLVDINKDNIPDNEVGSVRMVSPIINGENIENPLTRDGNTSEEINGFTVKIRAEKTGDSNVHESAGVDYIKQKGNFNNDIFNNGLVSGVGGIGIDTENKDGGTNVVNLGNTVVSVPENSNLNVNGTMTKSEKKDYGSLQFAPKIDSKEEIIMRKNVSKDVDLNMQFDMDDCSKVFKFIYNENGEEKEITPTYLKFDLSNDIKIEKTDANGVKVKEIDIKNIRNEKMSSVILVNVVGLNPYPYVFIITNTDKLSIEMGSGAVKMVRGVVLNKGEINITGEGTFHMNFSTMFGSEINIEADKNIAIDGVGTTIGEGMVKNKNELDSVLGQLFLNWGASESGGGSNQIKIDGNYTN